MVKHYRANSSELKPFTPTRGMLTDMGRIVRSCAEIEDIITLFLCDLAEIAEGKALILLGKSTLSAKLRLAGTFARAQGDPAKTLFQDNFENDTFISVIKCRNIIAHGILLGQDTEGLISFLTTDLDKVFTDVAHQEVFGFKSDHFRKVASVAESMVTTLESRLAVAALREKRRKLTLFPHSKSQPSRKPSVKHQRPPPS